MEMVDFKGIIRIGQYISLILLVIGFISIPFVEEGSPERVVTFLSIFINLIIVIISIFLNIKINRKNKEGSYGS